MSQYIRVQKLFKGGNYMRKYGIFENWWVWNLKLTNWDFPNVWVMDKKFEFFIENLRHVSIFLELLTKMDTTLKIQNLCNLKLHYVFKVWCQLGTQSHYVGPTCTIDIQIAIYIEWIKNMHWYLKPGLNKIDNITCFSWKLWL